MGIKFKKDQFAVVLTVALVMVFVSVLARWTPAQQPQTPNAPLTAVNAKYANGAAMGYWPQRPLSGLSLPLGPGTANCSGAIVHYAGGTLSMTDATTNYVYLDTSSSCAPSVKTTIFTCSDLAIAVVTTSGGSIINIDDVRSPFNVPCGASGTVPTLIASGSSALNIAEKAPGTCEDTVTTAATGAILGDKMVVSYSVANIFTVTGYNPTDSGGMMTESFWADTDTVNFSVCNSYFNPGNITPGAVTAYWEVLRP